MKRGLRKRMLVWLVAEIGMLCLSGCTRESVRTAIAAQRRADQIQQAVHDRQQESLHILLYRNLVAQLHADDERLTSGQQAALNQAWNDRDLVEFWNVQFERARVLRTVGVDMQLVSQQAVVDLLIKNARLKLERLKQGLTSFVARRAVTGARD